MARDGVNFKNSPYFWGKLTTSEIDAIVASGDFEAGDLVFNTTLNTYQNYNGSRIASIGSGGGSGDLMSTASIVAEARKRGSDISVPLNNFLVEAAESNRVEIPLHTDYTSSATSIKLTQKIVIETDNPVPIYLTDDTTGNYDEIWLKELTAEATGEYTYDLSAGVSNGYTTANSAYVTNSVGKFTNNSITQNSGASAGDVLLTSETNVFSYVEKETVTTGDLEGQVRFYSDKYPVTDLTNYASSGELVLTVDADYSTYIKDDNYICVFSFLDEYDNDEVVSPYKKLKQYRGNNTISWNIFQVKGDSTYSDPNITITVDKALDLTTGTFTSTLPTLDTGNTYYVVRIPTFKYIAGSKTVTAFTALWPKEFISHYIFSEIFSDDFNRLNGAPSNEWTVVNGGTSLSRSIGIVSNRIQIHTGDGGGSGLQELYRSLEEYNEFLLPVDIYFEFSHNINNATCSNAYFSFFYGCGGASSVNAYEVRLDLDNPQDQIRTYFNSLLRDTTVKTFTAPTTYAVRIFINKEGIKIRIWTLSSTEPLVWDVEVTENDPVFGNTRIEFYNNGSVTNPGQYDIYLDNVEINGEKAGFTTKYKEADLTNIDKFGGKAIGSKEAAADTMEIYEIGCGLVSK